jgi:nicotinate-nucleotide adenylyltransferase
MAQTIGVIGGSFDPIHHGHLILAEHLRSEAKLDKILFIPALIPPHKQKLEIAPSIHRMNMTRLAIASNPFFEASTIEIDAVEISYTINTMRHLKAHYASSVRIVLITGADTILEIEKWRSYKQLLAEFGFIVGNRPGYKQGELENHIEYLNKNYQASVSRVDIPEVEISSTDIKERIRSGKSIKYLTPECVENYIYKNDLYK